MRGFPRPLRFRPAAAFRDQRRLPTALLRPRQRLHQGSAGRMGNQRSDNPAIGSAVHRSMIQLEALPMRWPDPSSTATFSSGLQLRQCAQPRAAGIAAGELGESRRLHVGSAGDALQRRPSDATVYGNTPRNCIIGPPQKNVDFTLDKSFRLGERQICVSGRTSSTCSTIRRSPFRKPSMAIGGVVGDGGAPITTTVGTPRLIQFSLKYSF